MIVATYNVHRCVGADGRRRPERIADVLAELDVDLVALQELETGVSGSGVDALDLLVARTGMEAVLGPTLESGSSRYGNALLTRRGVSKVTRIDLSVPGREPRGAIDAVVETASGPLRVVATHLGLGRRERRAQAHALARRVGDGEDGTPVVLLGDLNSVSGVTLAPLRARMRTRPPVLRTFPARRPVLPLDRVWARPRGLVVDLRAHRSRMARIASDHLPLRARLELEP